MNVTAAQCQFPAHKLCERPLAGQFNGTFSITSMGGVASTFLLEWFRKLELAHHSALMCERGLGLKGQLLGRGQCSCDALSAGGPPRRLVSCHIHEDGVFKHLSDPSALNRFKNHRAVYVVGGPISAIGSIFRRRYQCWHLYRLNNCLLSRKQRKGLIPCEQPGILAFRHRFGLEASSCRVPKSGPLSSAEAYASQAEDLFGTISQFRTWLSCRRPFCKFDILVIRYETLNQSVSTLLDFLSIPQSARRHFPAIRVAHAASREAHGISPGGERKLRKIYGALDTAVAEIPQEGLILRNT